MAYKGIDVSTHQGKIDWKKVAASGIQFAVIRAGYGREISQKDKYFETNYSGARAAGIPVGAYWYSYADSVDRAKQEAATCLEAIQGKTFDLPVFFDQEYEKSILALSTITRTAICKAFCEAVQASGYTPGVYASTDWLNNKLNASELTNYSIWAAQYAASCTCKVSYDLWQYSNKGKINGISGSVDMNYMYNNPADTESSSSTASTTTTTGGVDLSTLSTIKTGSIGAQVTSLQLLLNGKNSAGLSVDGICGAKTVAAIKAYQQAKSLTVDGIAGVNTWTSLLTV